MIWKASIVISVALCVLGDRRLAFSEQKVEQHFSRHKGDLSHIGHQKLGHHEEYAWSYPSYEFSYTVDDPHTHDIKGQHEVRDGDEVKGSYWLIQPDGHKRLVKYQADDKHGFTADVQYSKPKGIKEDDKKKDKKEGESGPGKQGPKHEIKGEEKDSMKKSDDLKKGGDTKGRGKESDEEKRHDEKHGVKSKIGGHDDSERTGRGEIDPHKQDDDLWFGLKGWGIGKDDKRDDQGHGKEEERKGGGLGSGGLGHEDLGQKGRAQKGGHDQNEGRKEGGRDQEKVRGKERDHDQKGVHGKEEGHGHEGRREEGRKEDGHGMKEGRRSQEEGHGQGSRGREGRGKEGGRREDGRRREGGRGRDRGDEGRGRGQERGHRGDRDGKRDGGIWGGLQVWGKKGHNDEGGDPQWHGRHSWGWSNTGHDERKGGENRGRDDGRERNEDHKEGLGAWGENTRGKEDGRKAQSSYMTYEYEPLPYGRRFN